MGATSAYLKGFSRKWELLFTTANSIMTKLAGEQSLKLCSPADLSPNSD
jgi:hypothetical protein